MYRQGYNLPDRIDLQIRSPALPSCKAATDADLQNLTFQSEGDKFAAAKWFDHWTSIAKLAVTGIKLAGKLAVFRQCVLKL